MSDDEQTFREPPRPKPIPQADDSGRSEAQMMMDEKKEKDKAKMEEEIREYEEMRKEERETMEREIAELREKREVRKQERLEEERLLAEKRQADDQKRRAEEEERQRVKAEKEAAKWAAREQQRMEAEERTKNLGKRNFSITKKSGSGAQDADVSKEEVTKSKEQLEAEKQAILAQRVQPLDISGLGVDQLKEKAKELHDRLIALVGDKYDLENQCKTKNVEMSELAERARQMNKGQKQKVVGGEGGDDEDPMSQRFAGAPPKIQLCSKYERHTDRRNYGERKDVFTGPIFAEETARILPSWEKEGLPNPFEEAAKEAAAEEAAREAAE
ncbi:uncharacterized protein LOC141912539 isoform X6 [Tubulanus polymorphus]|uniref:uncharacterized protein LOC141912539 isoform X6 n=1 Tax=Tubulanus polymorphus TaxID=672921 RepID=UPI003DA29754